jgi:hypothetical protein
MMTLNSPKATPILPIPTDAAPWPATIAYYQACKDVRQTANHFQIKLACVYYRIKQAHISLFPARRGRPPKKEPKIKLPSSYPSRGRKQLCRVDIITFYQECKDIPQTADHFHVQLPAIYYHLKMAGIPIIPQRRQKRIPKPPQAKTDSKQVKESPVTTPLPPSSPPCEKRVLHPSIAMAEIDTPKKNRFREYPDIFGFRSYPINIENITHKIETGTLRTRPTKNHPSRG